MARDKQTRLHYCVKATSPSRLALAPPAAAADGTDCVLLGRTPLPTGTRRIRSSAKKKTDNCSLAVFYCQHEGRSPKDVFGWCINLCLARDECSCSVRAALPGSEVQCSCASCCCSPKVSLPSHECADQFSAAFQCCNSQWPKSLPALVCCLSFNVRACLQ